MDTRCGDSSHIDFATLLPRFCRVSAEAAATQPTFCVQDGRALVQYQRV